MNSSRMPPEWEAALRRETKLTLRFLQMTTQALEVLLHEFGPCENKTAPSTQKAVDQTVKGPKNPRAGFHGGA